MAAQPTDVGYFRQTNRYQKQQNIQCTWDTFQRIIINKIQTNKF